MRHVKRIGIMLISVATAVLLFQNCSNEQFGTENSASMNPSAGSGSNASGFDQNGGGGSAPAIANIAAGMVVEDKSYGNDSVVTRLTQKIYNAKPGLKGCTALISNYNSHCVKDADFILITSSQAWGANSYNSALDVYSVDLDISASQWPMTTYFTRYIASDGSRKEFIFTPSTLTMTKPARLQWVYTNPKACFGPTPAPAPVGESCSVEGDTRTNACGTVTCQFK